MPKKKPIRPKDLKIDPNTVYKTDKNSNESVTAERFALISSDIDKYGFENSFVKNTLQMERRRYSATPTFCQYERELIEICSKFVGCSIREFLEKSVRNECKRVIQKIRQR